MGGGCAASTAQGAAPLGTLLGGYRPLAPALVDDIDGVGRC